MIEFFPHSNAVRMEINDADFIVGLPSVGNFGQSAVDVIISTARSVFPNSIQLIGYGETENLLPMIGYESFSEGEFHLSHPIEFYQLENTKTIFVLIRSICRENEEEIFAKEFGGFLASKNYRSVFLLTGASAEEWDVNSMFITNEFFSFLKQNDSIDRERKILEKTWNIREGEGSIINQSNQEYPFGMELASLIFKQLSERVVILGKFAISSGNSDVESLSFPLFVINELSLLDRKDALQIRQLAVPLSWKFAQTSKADDLFPVW